MKRAETKRVRSQLGATTDGMDSDVKRKKEDGVVQDEKKRVVKESEIKTMSGMCRPGDGWTAEEVTSREAWAKKYVEDLQRLENKSREEAENVLHELVARERKIRSTMESLPISYVINLWSAGVCQRLETGDALRSHVRKTAKRLMRSIDRTAYACCRPLCARSVDTSELLYSNRTAATDLVTAEDATAFVFVADIYLMCGLRSHLISSVMEREAETSPTSTSSSSSSSLSASPNPSDIKTENTTSLLFMDGWTGQEVAQSDVNITHLVSHTRCDSCKGAVPYANIKNKCSRCKRVYYCNETCQRAHWKAGHKQMCRPYRETRPLLHSATSSPSGGKTLP
jgi:hypothetical protein